MKVEPDAEMQKLAHSVVAKNRQESNACGGSVAPTSFWPWGDRSIAPWSRRVCGAGAIRIICV